jgi:hypothetical protein
VGACVSYLCEPTYRDCRGLPGIPRVSSSETMVRMYGPSLVDCVTEFLRREGAKVDENGHLKYSSPLTQIQDIIGARVTLFYVRTESSRSDEALRWLLVCPACPQACSRCREPVPSTLGSAEARRINPRSPKPG